MQPRGLLRAAETDGERGWRTSTHLVLLALALYAAGFALFYPRTTTNEDEHRYLQQGRLLVESSGPYVFKWEPRTDRSVRIRASGYPVGNALLMTPFIWLGGWRGGFVVPALSLLAAVWFTGRWLREEGRSPLFALLALAFPASLVLGRVVLSDIPSMAAVAIGLFAFWRGQGRGPGWWLLAGFVAGASLMIRATNALPFVFFFAGAVLRRDRGTSSLVLGGCGGLFALGLAHALHFGDPFYVRSGYAFSPGTLTERLPLYLFGLLVLFPGGLLAGLAYRGRRRPELVATVVVFFLFYLLQAYGMSASGLEKRLVIALRYFCPLLPVLAFAAGEVVPRWWRRALAATPVPRRALVESAAGLLLAVWLLGVGTAAVAVHWFFDRWTASQADIQEAIRDHTRQDTVLVTNHPATRKHLGILDHTFLPVDRAGVAQSEVVALAKEHDVAIVLLDRSDSDYWRRDARLNEEFIEGFGIPLSPELDLRVTPTDRLRIWRVSGISSGTREGP